MEFALLVAVLTASLFACVLSTLVLLKLKGSRVGTGFDAQKDIAELKTRLTLLASRLDSIGNQLADEFERSRRESGQFQKDIRTETAQSLKNMGEKLDEMKIANVEYQRQLAEKVAGSLNAIHTTNIEQNERQSRIINESIGKLQESNEKKLDQMRATVDEKLNETLTVRLGQSFSTVSQQLESVNKSLGEMNELSKGVTSNVTSLNRVLTNVKARGSWGETQLEGILDQTIPNMYEKNFATQKASNDRVEFAVKIPSGLDNKEITYLPIDSKFPMEDYVRLCTAADIADVQGVLSARKALEARVLGEAKSVAKYINSPVTTPFAILYLATDGLFAEITNSGTGLPERLHRELNVMIAGPTTITALLNSLSMGFKAVAINDKANEVRNLLSAAKMQYEKFGGLLDKAKKKIDEAGRSLDEAKDRNRLIQGKLKNVDKIEYGVADEILGITASDDIEE